MTPPTPSVAREILRLTWPAVLTSLLQTAVFLADRLMLGRYSSDALASMQVQGPVLWSLEMIFMGLVVGTVALVARSVGAGDRPRAESVARVALQLAFALGVAVAIVVGLGVDLVVAAIGPDSPVLRGLSRDYLVVALGGMPFVFVSQAAAMVFWGAGDTRTPLVAGSIANALNVGLNYLLIYGATIGPVHVPELGVVGAAVASVVAYAFQAGVLGIALRRRASPIRLVFVRAPADARTLRDVLRVSTPAMLERLVNNGGYLAYASIITSLGALVMASNQSLITLEAICFLSADGFAVAAGTVVGQSLGRREPEQANRGGWIAVGFSVAALTSLGLVIWATAPWTLQAFVPSGQDGGPLIAESTGALPLLVLAQPFMATSVVLGQALRGAGDTKSPFFAAVLGGLLVRVGLAVLLARTTDWGVKIVWIASGVDWVVRSGFLAFVFVRGRWKSIEL